MAMKRNYNNNEFFLEWHPEMILISESPITWQGFLLISHASCIPHDIQYSRVKLKLILPNYPSFYDVQIRFGKQIAFLRNVKFIQKLKALLMNSAQTVPLFLRQLQSLIGEYMHKADSKLCMIDLDATSNFLKDLKTALQNSSNWDKNRSMLENIKMLLNTYEFPEPQENLEEKAIIGSHECGICYSADELPDKICNNERCMKHFHLTCLSKWLQTNARNQVVFNHIFGACPHCKENISCFIEW